MDSNGARGRVVMLVDNGVLGDSRVQKSARSAAQAGWDVVLIGRSGTHTYESWKLGDAEVRLLPVPAYLVESWFRRGRSLRRPLAYRDAKQTAHRLEVMKAWRADVTARINQARADGKNSRLLPSRVGLAVTSRWVRLRSRETRVLREARTNPALPLNKLSVQFFRTLWGERSWRKLDPSLWEWELAFAKTIDELEPDIIHAHDFKMIGVGSRAAARARGRGRQVRFVYDAHESVPGLAARTPGWIEAQVAYEREYIRTADAVVTVSEVLADMLRDRHGLPERPTVVLNAPVLAAEETAEPPVADLRTQSGLAADVPLIAYSGGITPVRGVDLVVEALADLPDVHLACLSLHPSGHNRAADKLRKLAEDLGVADRVHLLPYAPHWQVSRVLSTADLAVSPLLHLPNHHIAVSNKFFEYSHARLPLITSDVKTMSEVVRASGQGEVFRAGDKADFVGAVKRVLADPAQYRAAYDKPGLLEAWNWEVQASILDDLYLRLMPGTVERPVTAGVNPSPAVAPQAS